MKDNRIIDLRRVDSLGPITERRPKKYQLPEERGRGVALLLLLSVILVTVSLGYFVYHNFL